MTQDFTDFIDIFYENLKGDKKPAITFPSKTSSALLIIPDLL